MTRGLDTTEDLTGFMHELVAMGYGFAIKYSHDSGTFPRKTWDAAELEGALSVGIIPGMVFEVSVNPAYFTQSQGEIDGKQIAVQANSLQWPKLSRLGFTHDFDSTPEQMIGYAIGFQRAVKGEGFRGVFDYGNWLTCAALLAAGYVGKTWLDQSTGHQGHAEGLGKADIVQLPAAYIRMSTGRRISIDNNQAAVAPTWLHGGA